MSTNTLKKGESYDISTLDFTGWTEGDGSGNEGYNVSDYFRDGTYLGEDEHGIEPVVSFDALDYAAAMIHAINRSISHSEIARVNVPSFGRAEAIEYLDGQDDIEALDSAGENDGSLDVWGEYKGEEFRIRMVNTGA